MSHEHTSPEVAASAARVLAGKEYTDEEVRRAARAITSARDRQLAAAEVSRA